MRGSAVRCERCVAQPCCIVPAVASPSRCERCVAQPCCIVPAVASPSRCERCVAQPCAVSDAWLSRAASCLLLFSAASKEYDDIDRECLRRMVKERVGWSPAEDSLV